MANKKYKTLLATGLAVAGAVQMGNCVEANAAPKTGRVTTWQEAEAKVNSRLDSTRTFETQVDKGENANPDHNMQIVTVVGEASKGNMYRFTQEDGTPYTGLYKSVNTETGNPIEWYVLDENGCYQRDPMKPQFAWLNGYYSADFLNNGIGPNHDPSTDNWYLTDIVTIEGAELKYIVFDKWQGYGGVWYRSNAEGVCYRNQWFQDTDGKWYYFDDKCRMVTNQSIDGYWIGSDGAWVQ